ncbi:RNA 3'-terminal phosphate cyclase [Boletus edulis BED1]|uniref:RNA 3'-terminal phosphate cyclase n=1 Tax=Boletus edulis BED1 TaxID=1328754 RepID=A0AAD4BQC4_BOLED|nr:RNA 3'-terminal phosphate cyclase [Boletus edulis BED1]
MTSSIAQSIVQIDGSFCEGGGQLLRNAVALSALLSKPISIFNVRQNRRPPGLRRQHEAGINLAASICSADTKGVEVDSTMIDFRPGPIQLPKTLSADPGTAGSTTLLLQIAFPCLLFSPSAHQAESESQEAPYHFGISPTLTVHRRGYYPKGGGSVLCTVPAIPGPLFPVVLTERGEVNCDPGECPPQRMVSDAHRTLVASGIPARKISITAVRERDQDVVGAGGGILLWAETDKGCLIAGSAVSIKEKKPKRVGEEAAKELVRNLSHGGCVDEYLQDQMIIFLALAQGTSIVKTGPLTDHTRTAIHIAQRMTGARFHLDENGPDSTTITCEGIGFTPSSR